VSSKVQSITFFRKLLLMFLGRYMVILILLLGLIITMQQRHGTSCLSELLSHGLLGRRVFLDAA
jgi:hypothetical protein